MNQTSQRTTQDESASKRSERKSAIKNKTATENHLRHRVEDIQHLVSSVRKKAEVTFRDNPYALPLAAGAVGVGVGMLLGSKVMRLVAVAAAGTIINETLGGELKQVAKSFVRDVQDRIEEMSDEDEDEGSALG